MMRKISQLPVIEWKSIKEIKETRRILLVTSPSAEKTLMNSELGKNGFTQKLYIDNSSYSSVEQSLETITEVDVVYAVGGGSVIDVGRYLAAKLNKEIVCIPTIISTDAFLVDCTGLRENACVRYHSSKIADKVILDWNLLGKIPSKLNISGCGDVLSIFTGLFDWKYANEKGVALDDELYSESIAVIAEAILKSLFVNKEEIKKESQKGVETIVTALAMEVVLCNFYGNSRPEEGGEHFFTYCIENKMNRFLHGEMVSLGILVTATIQGQNIKEIKEFMDYIGINYRPEGVSREIIIETLKELSSYVKEHSLRYSIYNDFEYENHKDKLDTLFDSINL